MAEKILALALIGIFLVFVIVMFRVSGKSK